MFYLYSFIILSEPYRTTFLLVSLFYRSKLGSLRGRRLNKLGCRYLLATVPRSGVQFCSLQNSGGGGGGGGGGEVSALHVLNS